jgi:hypothetical protein
MKAKTAFQSKLCFMNQMLCSNLIIEICIHVYIFNMGIHMVFHILLCGHMTYIRIHNC